MTTNTTAPNPLITCSTLSEKENTMKTTRKNYPNWIENLPSYRAQPWGVYDQRDLF